MDNDHADVTQCSSTTPGWGQERVIDKASPIREYGFLFTEYSPQHWEKFQYLSNLFVSIQFN